MYIENLQKLYDKAKAVDSLHDESVHVPIPFRPHGKLIKIASRIEV